MPARKNSECITYQQGGTTARVFKPKKRDGRYLLTKIHNGKYVIIDTRLR